MEFGRDAGPVRRDRGRGRRVVDRHREGGQPARHQPRRADGLHQRPGREGPGAGAAAAAAGRDPDHHRHRQREHHDLRAGRAVAEGEDRHQPPRAAAAARDRRPLAHHHPARRWSPPRPGWTSSATRWRATRRGGSPTSTPSGPRSGCPTAARTRSPTCGRSARSGCWPGRSAAAVRDGSDGAGPRADGDGRDVRRARLRQRRRAHPARQRLPDRGPGARLPARGLPAGRADRPARDGGVADRAGGVPVHVRRRAGAAPAGRRAARRRRRAAGRTRWPACWRR